MYVWISWRKNRNPWFYRNSIKCAETGHAFLWRQRQCWVVRFAGLNPSRILFFSVNFHFSRSSPDWWEEQYPGSPTSHLVAPRLWIVFSPALLCSLRLKTVHHVTVCPDPYFSNVGPFVGFLPGDLFPPSSPTNVSPTHTSLVLHLPWGNAPYGGRLHNQRSSETTPPFPGNFPPILQVLLSSPCP